MIEKVGIIAEENKNARLEIRPALNNSHALKCECTPYYVIGKLLTLLRPFDFQQKQPKELRKSPSQYLTSAVWRSPIKTMNCSKNEWKSGFYTEGF